jgi:hypothetical protein
MGRGAGLVEATAPIAPWHSLNRLPLPQGHGWLRPTITIG